MVQKMIVNFTSDSGASARFLCDRGADVNALNIFGDSPLYDAVLYCRFSKN